MSAAGGQLERVLVLLRADEETRATIPELIVLDNKVMLLGRSVEAHIHLNPGAGSANTISRRHAEFLLTDDGTTRVSDCGSLNGVFVNRKKISSTRLHDGDEIQFGGAAGLPTGIEIKSIPHNAIIYRYEERARAAVAVNGESEKAANANGAAKGKRRRGQGGTATGESGSTRSNGKEPTPKKARPASRGAAAKGNGRKAAAAERANGEPDSAHIEIAGLKTKLSLAQEQLNDVTVGKAAAEQAQRRLQLELQEKMTAVRALEQQLDAAKAMASLEVRTGGSADRRSLEKEKEQEAERIMTVLKKAQADNHELKYQIRRMAHDYAELKMKFERTMEEKEAASASMARTGTDYARTLSEMREVRAENCALAASLTKVEAENAELRSRVIELMAAQETNAATLTRLKSENAELHRRIKAEKIRFEEELKLKDAAATAATAAAAAAAAATSATVTPPPMAPTAPPPPPVNNNVSVSNAGSRPSATTISLERFKSELGCALCGDLLMDAGVLHCSHAFCFKCLHSHLQKKRKCPVCETLLPTTHPPYRSANIDMIIAMVAEGFDGQEKVTWEKREAANRGFCQRCGGEKAVCYSVKLAEDCEREDEEQAEADRRRREREERRLQGPVVTQRKSEEKGVEAEDAAVGHICEGCSERGHFVQECPYAREGLGGDEEGGEEEEEEEDAYEREDEDEEDDDDDDDDDGFE